MRVFVAIDLDSGARAALGEATDSLRKRLPDFDRRWRPVARQNLHLTLHFLGELDAPAPARLAGAIGAVLDRPAFTIGLDRIGRHPPRGRARVLWAVPGAGREPLLALHAETTGRLHRAGLVEDERPLRPHVTLARSRDRSGTSLPRDFDDAATLPSHVEWRVAQVTVYQSVLTSGPPRYDVLHRAQLSRTPGTE